MHTGGDVAFLNGVLKVLLAEGGVDRRFVRDHTDGLRRAARGARARVVRRSRAAVGRDRAPTWSASPGCTRDARSAVLVWSMGITQHAHGTDNVAAIVNLALARGNVGRPGAGLMPIRGHSGVQGGAEMGAYATAFPGGVAIDARVGGRARRAVRLPGRRPGRASPPRRWSRPAGRGEIDVLYSTGGNFLEVLPDPDAGRRARSSGCRCACTRTSSCRARCSSTGRGRRAAARGDPLRAARRRHRDDDRAAHRLQPRDPGHRGRRGAQRVGDLRRPRARVDPERAAPGGVRLGPGDPRRDRARRAVVRGSRAPARRPATRSSGAARASAKAASSRRPTAGRTSSRSRRRSRRARRAASCSAPGAASSSTRWCTRTAIRSPAAMRDALFMRRPTIRDLGLATATAVVVRSSDGEMSARGAPRQPIRPGNVQVFFPEGNVLLRAGPARRGLGRARLQRRSSRWSRHAVTPDDHCSRAASARRRRRAAQRRCAAARAGLERRARTDRAGQYQLDLVADAAVLPVLDACRRRAC